MELYTSTRSGEVVCPTTSARLLMVLNRKGNDRAQSPPFGLLTQKILKISEGKKKVAFVQIVNDRSLITIATF